MRNRIRLIAAFLALLIIGSTLVLTGRSAPASAAPALICTWTGNFNLDISVADNWNANSGQSCGGSSTVSDSATLSGAELVFPASIPSSGSDLTLDLPERVDDVVFDGSYVISGSSVLTLVPSLNSSVGIDVAVGGGATILTPIDLGQSQIFAVAQYQQLYLEGDISGASYSLTMGNASNTGTVYMKVSNSYSGSTTVAVGSLEIENSGSLGTGPVTVDSGASLLEYGSSSVVDPTNDITISGAGSVGNSGALEDFTGGDGWAGKIVLDGAASIATESNSHPFDVTGSIGGVGPLTITGAGTLDLGGTTDYSGSTTISPLTTLKSEIANALPATTSLTVGSGGVYDLTSFAQTLASLSGIGAVTSSGASPVTLALAPATSDMVDTTITGNIELELDGSSTATLSSLANSYTQGTLVVSGTLRSGAANSLPSGSQLNVAGPGAFDMAGYSQELSEISGAGSITSSSGSPTLSLDVPGGVTDLWSGALTGSLGLISIGTGTLVIGSGGNSYIGSTSVSSGTVDVTGSAKSSVFSVSSGAVLEGGGIIGGVSSNGGTVHPGVSLGILTSSGAATLGKGSLAVDVTGSQAGAGYSQFAASGNAVDVNGATLSITDSYAAGYGTVFDIVTAGSVTGSFANAAWGSDITTGGRKLQLGHTLTAITLTDVTDPPQAPGPVQSPGGSTTNPVGTAQASGDGITVTGQGDGAITVYNFPSDPVGPPTFSSAGEYFGVGFAGGGSFSSVTIVDCNLNGGSQLEWWNPAAGSGEWQDVSPPATLIQGDPPCLTFTATALTVPNLSQLSDAIFAIANNSASTPDGKGYWLVASDGGVFSFGDAQFYGSMGGKHLNKPVVGMAETAGGLGYWLVGQDGGVFTFGNAGFFGSGADNMNAEPVSAITASPSGKGYWLVASDGYISSYGDAAHHGSLSLPSATSSAVAAVALAPGGEGFLFAQSDGSMRSSGTAQIFGSAAGMKLEGAIVGIAYSS